MINRHEGDGAITQIIDQATTARRRGLTIIPGTSKTARTEKG
jgi:hypothetical protein